MLTKILLSIAVLLAIAFLILVVIRIKNDNEVSKIWQELADLPTEHVFTEDMVASLPSPVQRYFLHAITPGTPLASAVTLEMSGSFRLGEDKPWVPMQAKQRISLLKGFVWQATVGRGLSQFVGADYYIKGTGRMRFSLWGLVPLVNAHTHDIARSSLGRLAGEFVWLPSALLPQQGVIWQAIDERTVQASFVIDDEPVTLRLIVDADGKVLQLSLPRWGDATEDGSWNYIPFGVEFQAEQQFGGFTIPSQMNAGWWFGTEHYLEFFRATIAKAEFE
ncbi:DUF6920 family protein [Fischerella thermalis]|jgi:hypothetical protein|uniref:DUF6920 family protein n=1 Tax=Fischerella thermalis TaxID=372787 RepID=UPI0002EBAA3B|nr:DUF6544 family protein [Fischerella thermalis]PMB08975.1 hypothetical protein CI592_06950 [Fischerella thermalis CCMEE 5328]PLZ05134.1 hypothetical protein CBP17_21475 [Fischerella thermalis WC114]PLZ10654.1 hypothetical protein CBP18_10395 [Fischerella thermalis WC119]PLZ15093.1 hypothetical protein CBP19_07240 [Fischerella thermalis WC1110]PLZ17139.1 hypothetical protein CBP30_20770 [Fischerella thermalis WC157]